MIKSKLSLLSTIVDLFWVIVLIVVAGKDVVITLIAPNSKCARNSIEGWVRAAR